MNSPIIKQAIQAWFNTVKQANKLLEQISDEDLLKPIAPNKNTGYYLLGHLTAVNDLLLSLLDLGEPLFPEIKSHFIRTPDNVERAFSIAELKEKWSTVNAELEKQFNQLTADEWLLKHKAISDADFAKEPHRNRFNVLLNRTNHMSYHIGQLVLLKS